MHYEGKKKVWREGLDKIKEYNILPPLGEAPPASNFFFLL